LVAKPVQRFFLSQKEIQLILAKAQEPHRTWYGLAAAGYSLSVAENAKQRIWKPQVRAEYERVKPECTN
jgi:hypothetical protein